MKGTRSTLPTAVAIGLLAGSVTGAVAQDEVAPPVEFTAEWGFTSEGCCSVIEPASDPRFVGAVGVSFWADEYPSEDGLRVASRAFHVENDKGTWRGVPGTLLFYADGTASGVTQTFIGEGDYEDSYAVVDITTTPGAGGGVELHGLIIDGEPPVATP